MINLALPLANSILLFQPCKKWKSPGHEITTQPCSQVLSSSLPLEREREGKGKKRDPGNEAGLPLFTSTSVNNC